MNPVFHSADINRVADLCLAAGFDRLIVPSEPVALKIHFGEPGNTAYLKPEAVRPVAELVGKLHGKPFYTDCNTLYRGPRQQTSTHLDVARDHGYFLERAGADAVIPEESDQVAVEIKRKHFRQVYLGGPIARTGTLIALTHFKGHEVTGSARSKEKGPAMSPLSLLSPRPVTVIRITTRRSSPTSVSWSRPIRSPATRRRLTWLTGRPAKISSALFTPRLTGALSSPTPNRSGSVAAATSLW